MYINLTILPLYLGYVLEMFKNLIELKSCIRTRDSLEIFLPRHGCVSILVYSCAPTLYLFSTIFIDILLIGLLDKHVLDKLQD